jgi:hypothetical protein
VPQRTLHKLYPKDGLNDSNLLRTLIDSLPAQTAILSATETPALLGVVFPPARSRGVVGAQTDAKLRAAP